MHRDNKIDTKDKKCLTVRNIEKKEIKRVNAYKVKQNTANFKKKHREAQQNGRKIR